MPYGGNNPSGERKYDDMDDFSAIHRVPNKSSAKMGKGDEPGAGELQQNFKNPNGPGPVGSSGD